MSVQVLSWVLKEAPRELKPAEMLVAISLANHASSDGGHAYPSVQVIMEETHLSRRGVQSSLRSLEERGVIMVEQEATPRLPAMYAFLAFRGAQAAPQKKQAKTGAQSVREGAQILPSGAQPVPLWGAESAPKPSVATVREPSSESSEPARDPALPIYPPLANGKGSLHLWHSEWSRPESWDEFARNQGFNARQIEHHWDEFRDYWLGKGIQGKKADWLATWRTWLRRAGTFGAMKPSGSQATHEPKPPRPPNIEQILQPAKQLSPEKREEILAWRQRRTDSGTSARLGDSIESNHDAPPTRIRAG